jgi:hypothetical protein
MKWSGFDEVHRWLFVFLAILAVIVFASMVTWAQTPREPVQNVYVPCPKGWTESQCVAWRNLQIQINDRAKYPFEAIRTLARNGITAQDGDSLIYAWIDTVRISPAGAPGVDYIPGKFSSATSYSVIGMRRGNAIAGCPDGNCFIKLITAWSDSSIKVFLEYGDETVSPSNDTVPVFLIAIGR